MNLFQGLFGINSLLLIGLILSQNESSQNSATTQTSSSSLNPLENITIFSFIAQLSFLVINIKLNEL